MSITYEGMSISSTASTIRKAAVAPNEIKIFDGLNNKMLKEVSVGTTPTGKCEKFVADCNDRQQSRRNHYFGMINKTEQIKTCTGNEVMVVLWNADRECFYVLSTNTEKLNYDVGTTNNTTLSTPLAGTPSSSSRSNCVDFSKLESLSGSLKAAMTSPLTDPLLPIPALAEFSELLSSSSPTKPISFPKKMTARKFCHPKRNACRICGIEGDSEEDIETDLPWIGCQYVEGYKTKNDRCSY